MTRTKILTPWLCSFLLTFAACDKDESLGEVETESESGESESGSDTEGDSDSQTSTSGSTESESDTVGCTADAMICPDGSSVGRSGPDCEFDPCPDVNCTADAMICPDGSSVGRSGPDCEFDPCPGDPPVSCDEGFVPAEPATCPSGGTPTLEAAGCYVACDNAFDPCEGGDICTLVQTNPCPCPDDADACCGACAGDTLLCLPPSADEACAALVGETFRSIEELECGLTPDGVALCNWTIMFDAAGGWDWQYSDVGEAGNYTCDAGVLRIVEHEEIEAVYSLDTGILAWDGVEYSAGKM